jgi:hypothetical protein
MKLNESPLPPFLKAASVDRSNPEEDQPSDGGGDHDEDDSFENRFPIPSDIGGLERGYSVEIFGDERGGQTPKRPLRRKEEEL